MKARGAHEAKWAPPRAHDAPHAVAGEGPVLSVRDVCVAYAGHRVLDSVDLDVARGEFVGVVGPNGGGKSTLLKAVMGLITPECGEVRVFDTPVRRFRGFTRIGYVPQHVVNVDLRFPVTALEVVLLGRVPRRGLFRRLTRADRETAIDAMDEVGVTHLADQLIGELSGGQRQRVFLAKALASEPDLLILDEPTTGVDPKNRDTFYHLLDHLNHDHGMTILLVSHDTQAIALTAHRLVALNRTIVYDGPPEAFEASGGFAATYDLQLHHHPADDGAGTTDDGRRTTDDGSGTTDDGRRGRGGGRS